MKSDVSDDCSGDNRMHSEDLKAIDDFMKNPANEISDLRQHITERNLPWVLSVLLTLETQKGAAREVLDSHFVGSHWDVEAFEYFFAHNAEKIEVFTRELLRLLKEFPLKNKPQIFLLLLCARTYNEDLLKEWDGFLKEIVSTEMMSNFCDRDDSCETKPLFRKGEFVTLWKYPILVPNLILSLSTTNKTTVEYELYQKIFNTIPTDFLDKYEYMFQIVSRITCRVGMHYIHVENLPRKVRDRIEKTVFDWMRNISLCTTSGQLVLSDTPERMKIMPVAIRKTVYEYMESVLASAIPLEQDLNVLYEVHRSRVVPLREIIQLLYNRWRKEDAKARFFEQARHICDHFFFTLLPESTVKSLLPPTAVGSAARTWLIQLEERRIFSSQTEPQTLEMFAKLLAQNVVSNDPLLPEDKIKPNNIRQQHFLLKFLQYSFSTLRVETLLCNASAAVELLGSENLDKPNLFLQCIHHWAKGGMSSQRVPSFSETELTFKELHLVLERSKRLNMLCKYGAPVFSIERCKNAVTELKVLNRLSDVQVLCAYSPFLPEKISNFLLVERSWLDGVSEDKWAHEKVKRLLRCVDRVKLLFQQISEDVQELIFMMCAGENRRKSFLFDNFMRNYYEKVIQLDEVHDISVHFKAALTFVKQQLENVLVSLANESLTAQEARQITDLIKKGGWSMQQELNVLRDSGVYKLSIEMENQILRNLIRGEENCFLLEGVQRLLFPHEEECTLDYFDFALCKTQDEDLIRLRSKIEHAPNITGMPLTKLQEYALFVMNFFPGSSVIAVARIFSVLADLKLFENLWRFFERNPTFVGTDGMCTYNFIEQIDGYLARLGRGKADIVESFKFLSQFIVVLLRSSKLKSIKELITSLAEAPAVSKQISGDEREWNLFVESLISINGEMRVVEDVFKGKEDPYDAVVSLYEYAQRGFIYYYKLDSSEVSIAFRKEEIVEHLDNNDTLEFQLQLRFALRDDPKRFPDSEDGTSAESFLRELEGLFNTLDTLHHLHSVGHPKFSSANLFVSSGNNPPPVTTKIHGFIEVTRDDMKSLEEMQRKWAEELSSTIIAHPWLSLISTPLAREMSLAFQMNNVSKATLLLYPFFKHSEISVPEIKEGYQHINDLESDNWLKYLTTAIQSLTDRFPSPQKENVLTPPSTNCKVYACEMDYDVWFALEKIYKKDKIYPFQILWCECSTDSACLEGILLRAKYYKQFQFTIVRPELLPYPMQQRLLRYLLQDGNTPNICFIECADSLIRSAHSIKVEMDFSKELSSIQEEVFCFCGESGSGKTYQLYKALKEETSSPKNSTECCILVSESFRVIDAVEALQSAVLKCNGGEGLVVAMRFSVGCYSASERTKWQELFRMVNTVLFGILKMKCVEDSVTGMLACIPEDIHLTLLVELPPTEFFWEESQVNIINYFPLLESENVAKIDCREKHFDLGDDAKDVAKYLKAYEDKTIDSKFNDAYRDDFDVLFMLDISGSMRKNNRLEICKDSILSLVEKMTPKDRVGLTTYNEDVNDIWDINFCTPGNLRILRSRLESVEYMGGSYLYKAICHGGETLLKSTEKERMQYLVVLSDGASEGHMFTECSAFLNTKGKDLRIIFMAIEIPEGFRKTVHNLVVRSSADCLISTTDKTGKIAEAFGMVGQHMSVNEQIQRNAEDMKDEDVPRLIWKYMDPKSHPDWSRVHMQLWIRYMHRRCGILASSSRFDRNTDKPTYGSTTMSMMLLEAEHAVGKNHVQWTDRAHQHMVYRCEVIKSDDGKLSEDYTWSVIAMNHEKDENWEKKRQLMETLQIVMPEKEDLQDRRVLESYLAQATGAELEQDSQNYRGKRFDFPLGYLRALDENRFVLTLDYLMKMLMINERVNCQAPCIIMGETGVSKTRVTEMLFKLKNYVKTTETHELSKILNNDTNVNIDHDTILQNLCQWLRTSMVPLRGPEGVDSILSLCKQKEDVRKQLGTALLQVFSDDPSLDPLKDMEIQCLQNLQDPTTGPENICKVIKWLMNQSTLEKCDDRKNWMFVVVNMHSAMTAKEITYIVEEAAARARRLHEMGKGIPNFLLHQRAQICIFFDEFNTSSCMGLLKEVIQDRTLKGKDLPLNLVPIAACNPYRTRKQVHDTERMNEQGTEWMSGHYNVRRLPKSLLNMTWDYGSLALSQEEEFIRKRMTFEKLNLSKEKESKLVNCVMIAHSTTRDLAKRHMKDVLMDVYPDTKESETEDRGNSAVSLRDILRFFRMFHYFVKGIDRTIQTMLFYRTGEDDESLVADAMILSIVLVYYLRLSVSTDPLKNFRKIFSTRMEQLGVDIEGVMHRCFNVIIKYTELEAGVVKTKSLQENIATILLSVASKTPLIIKGPPGTSKTLAVQILCENAHGEFSKNDFYRALPAMNSVHYQCSRQSSSKEITEVFERAIKSQKSSNEHGSGHTVYFVFMDEAGLPEEERESLKVLHYYLESNTRRSTEVGFVAITNQLLDAANSNRCNMLLRAKYDGDELKTLAEGCLSLDEERPAYTIPTHISVVGRDDTVYLKEVVDLLCDRFENFIATFQVGPSTPNVLASDSLLPDGCADFFSLRDFMHFFKLLGRIIRRLEDAGGVISTAELVESFQRNFNGLEPQEVRQLVSYFLSDFTNVQQHLRLLLNPLKLVEDSRREAESYTGPPVSRYILVTDTTSCNAVLMELKNLFSIHIIRLGLFNHSVNQEQMNALGEVCWSASRGQLIGLVNTQSIHEGLYDLFNQHYKIVRQNQKTVLRTNIAVGSLSVACDVSTDFGCIVFMSESELYAAPAAFLDRLEKYRITMKDVLHHYVSSHENTGMWSIIKPIVRPLYDSLVQMIDSVGNNAFYGLKEKQSVESAVISLLRRWEADHAIVHDILRWKDLVNSFYRDNDFNPEDLCEDMRRLLNGGNQNTGRDMTSLLFQVGQRELTGMLLSVAIPEKIVFRLSSELMRQYLQNHNFCFDTHLSRSADSSHVEKELIFTRYVSTNFEKTYADKGNNFHVLDFSTMSSETELKSKLNDLLMSNNDLIVLYDLSRCGISQLNFCRHCIDARIVSEPSIPAKKILIVTIISSSDTLTLHTYDTVLNTDWKLYFMDSIGSNNILPWIRIAFEDSNKATNADEESSTAMMRELRKCVMETCAPLLVGSLKRNTHPCCKATSRHVPVAEILSILNSKIADEGTKFADFIAKKFSTLWSDNGTNTIGIQQHIRSVINSQNESPLTGCLAHTFELELNDLLSRELVFFLQEAISTFNTFPIAENQKGCANIFFDILDSIPSIKLFKLGALSKPTFLEQINMPYKCGFPFYQKIKDTVSHVISQVYDFSKSNNDHDDGVISVDEWEDVLEDAFDALDKLQDPVAKAATKRLWNMKNNNSLFLVYLENFVADRFPLCSKTTREYATKWLHQRLSLENAIPMLHILSSYKNKPLSYFVSNIENISEYLLSDTTCLATTNIDLTSEESQINYLFSVFEHVMKSGDHVGLTKWLAVTHSLFRYSESKLSRSASKEVYIMKIWTSVCLAQQIICNKAVPRALSGSNSMGVTITPFLKRLYTELRGSGAREIDFACVLGIMTELDSANALFYVSQMQFASDELNRNSIWKVMKKPHWDPALLSLAVVRMKQYIADKNSSAFENFINFYSAANDFPALLEISDMDYEAYTPNWIVQEPQEMMERDLSFRVVFVLMRNWILIWCQDSYDTTLGNRNSIPNIISQVEEIMIYIDSLSDNPMKSVTLSALKHLFIQSIADLCAREVAEINSPVIYGGGVKILLRNNEDENTFWIRLLRDELQKLNVSVPRIDAVKRKYSCLDGILTKALQKESKEFSASLSIAPKGLPPFSPIYLNVFNIAKTLFSDEMQSIEVMYRMWILPLLMDMHAWAWKNRHKNTRLLEISDPVRRSKWVFLSAALTDAKQNCPALADLQVLPKNCDTPQKLLRYRDDLGNETPGLLHSIMKRFITAYEECVVQRWEKNEYQRSAAFYSFPCAQNPFDINDLIEGNEQLIYEVNMERSTAVTISSAESMLTRNRRRFEICGPLACLLQPLSIFTLSQNVWAENRELRKRIQMELHDFIERHTIIIPENLWKKQCVLVSPTSTQNSTLSDTRKQVELDNLGLNFFLHSLNLHGLRQLKTLVLRAQKEEGSDKARLENVVRRWVESESSATVSNVVQWLSEFIGLSNGDSCSILLSMSLKDARKIIRYVDQQIEEHAYIFADKPIELKDRIPEIAATEINAILASVPREQLLLLTRFLSDHEEKIERNARKNQIDHQLISLLAESFHSREMLYRQHPALLKIDAQRLKIGKGEQFSLCTCHYISFLQCILQALRSADSQKSKIAAKLPSNWSWQTEQESNALNSPEENAEQSQERLWEFLLPSPEWEKGNRNKSISDEPSHNLRRVRGQLALCLKSFDGKKSSMDAIHELLLQLPRDDHAPITVQAISVLDTNRAKLMECYRIIQTFGNSSGLPTNIDTRDVQNALEYIENAEEQDIDMESTNAFTLSKTYYNELMLSLECLTPLSPLPLDQNLHSLFVGNDY